MNANDTTGLDELIAHFGRPAVTGNRVREVHPFNTFVILAGLATLAIALPGIIPFVAVTLVYIAIAYGAGIGRRYLALLGKLYAVVGVILFVLRAIFFDAGQRLFVFGPFIVSTGGLLHALTFTLLVMTLCAMVVLFFALVPMQRLMLALEERGTSPHASYVILASFQAIIDLGRNARTVMDAQRSRGIETEGSVITRMHAFLPVLAPVFLAAMAQADERALALDARGFNLRGAHTHLVRLPRVPAWEVAITIVVAALACAAIAGAFTLWR